MSPQVSATSLAMQCLSLSSWPYGFFNEGSAIDFLDKRCGRMNSVRGPELRTIFALAPPFLLFLHPSSSPLVPLTSLRCHFMKSFYCAYEFGRCSVYDTCTQ
ncbi:hypothetical protein M405DRAFT_817378 [Rhizopogon salebrosus TDB-379]|nr:hypothetical protein M405DRAFT_817378 [Rhizopogon salebrosus TDB-379]